VLCAHDRHIQTLQAAPDWQQHAQVQPPVGQTLAAALQGIAGWGEAGKQCELGQLGNGLREHDVGMARQHEGQHDVGRGVVGLRVSGGPGTKGPWVPLGYQGCRHSAKTPHSL
jgi:hypothetical protein